jgi:hypothetical protein
MMLQKSPFVRVLGCSLSRFSGPYGLDCQGYIRPTCRNGPALAKIGMPGLALPGPKCIGLPSLAIAAHLWMQRHRQHRLAIDLTQRIPGDFVDDLQPFWNLVVSKPCLRVGENVVEYRLP